MIPIAQIDEASSLVQPFLFGILGVAGLLILIAIVKSILCICPPNEVFVFNGMKSRAPDGSARGFYPLFGGRKLRIPFIHTVQRMSLETVEVPITIRNAYSQGGIPLSVEAIANVKITNDEKLIANAVERFLGRDPSEMRRVAKETLEGHLRGVLARLTPEEVNEDRLKFADELSRESEMDLSKLGIHLDIFKILHVSDEVHYLDSIGRAEIANVVRDAEIAESDARREAELVEADQSAKSQVMEAQVEATISQIKNDLRRIQADLSSQVQSEEERTLAAAREARAKAEQELQGLRSELEAIRLQCDAVLPAEAARVAQEFKAKGDAALFRARGQAVSEAVETLNKAWADAGESAMSLYLIDDIEKLLAAAAKGVEKVSIDNLNLIDSGDGSTLPAIISAYPAMLASVFDAVEKTTGINVPQAISVREKTSEGGKS